MSVLKAIQETIQGLHDVDLDLDVTAYMVDDAMRRDIPGAKEGLPEQLFVREEQDAMEIALYIAPSVVAALEQDDPHTRLHAGNLESYCIALEGVSHFVFLTWRASVGWPVSALEMEIQAEVDKFIAAWLLMRSQGITRRSVGSELVHQLFESYQLRDEIDQEEAERYHVASKVAAVFCRKLAQRYSGDQHAAAIRRAARKFYRTTLAEKMRSVA